MIIPTDKNESFLWGFSNNEIHDLRWCIPNTSLSGYLQSHCEIRSKQHEMHWRRVVLIVQFGPISITGSMGFLTPRRPVVVVSHALLDGPRGLLCRRSCCRVFLTSCKPFWNQTETIINHSINHSSFGLSVPFNQTKGLGPIFQNLYSGPRVHGMERGISFGIILFCKTGHFLY